VKPRRLKLSVRRRARAAAGHTTSPTGHTWRPLTLCWKRNPLRARQPGPRCVARTLHQEFHTQAHLHLAQFTHNVTERFTQSRSLASAMPGIRPVILARLAPQNFTRNNEILQPVRERIWRESLLRTERSHTTSTRESPAARSARHHDATGPESPAMPRSLPVASTVPRIPHPVAITWTDVPRHSTRATPQRQRQDAEPPAQRRARSAPALVWPNLAPQSAPQAFEPGIEQSSPRQTPGNATARTAPATHIAALPVQVQNFSRETQRALLLDASFTERLAEDVLKKVDKRLRIERERRGL
jgi:hypothetical protein